MSIEIRTIESYLPVFNGFYGTSFEADETRSIDEGKTYDDYEWNHDEYRQRVAKACVTAVAEQLTDLDIKVEFQALVSPKYYNYSNDSINVEYQLGEDSFKKLLQYILDFKEDFDGFIHHNYTSYDGFMSFFSNDGTEWIINLIKGEKINHVFGACMEFYLEHNEFDVETLLQKLEDDGELIVYGKLIEVDEN